MSNFDLRKFLAEQKAPKTENVEEAHHDEGMDHNEAMGHDDANEVVDPDFFSGDNALKDAFKDFMKKAKSAGSDTVNKLKGMKLGSMMDAMQNEMADMADEAMDHKDEGMGHKDEAMHHNDKLEGMDHKDEGMGKDHGSMEEAAIDPVTVAAGVSALFAGAAGLSKLIDKLKAGEFGDRGKKLAQGLEKAGKAAGSTAQQRTASGPDSTMDEQEIKENKFKSSIKEILNS